MDYDWEAIHQALETDNETTQCYVVCSSPWGGGEIVGRLLRMTGVCGLPHYFFHDNKHTNALVQQSRSGEVNEAVNYIQYLKYLQRHKTSASGVFGLLAYPAQVAEHTLLLDSLINVKWIVVRRKDTAAQAVDAVHMAEVFQKEEGAEIEYAYGRLVDCFATLMKEELVLRRYVLSKSSVLELQYDDVVGSPLNELNKVLSFLDLKPLSKKAFAKYKFVLEEDEQKSLVTDRFRNILIQKKILREP